jgi:ankyrin repeat protein
MKVWLAASALALSFAGVALAQEETPLVAAARAGDTEAALDLVRRADVDAASEDGSTALLWAAHHGDLELAERLVRAGADVSLANRFGATPLREAATLGNVEIMDLLLRADANPDSANADGLTALMIVARTANVEAARLLLENGASVDATEALKGHTALHLAAAASQPEMVRILVEYDADPNIAGLEFDWDGRHVTAEPRVTYKDAGGFTPLLFAAREGCLECARILVEAGADVNQFEPDGVTPLIMAIHNSYYDTAKFLLENGANPSHADWWGRTALWEAVDMNTIPRGGRPDRPSLDETKPLQLIQMLLEMEADPNPQLRFLPPFRAVGADRGGDLMLTGGATPLLRATKAGDAEATRLLLEHGARADLAVYPQWRDRVGGLNPLHAAAGLGYQMNDTRGKFKTEDEAIVVIDLLLAAGADINAVDDRGQTALHGAVFRGWNTVVRHLIENGADPMLEDASGVSALEAARGEEVRLPGRQPKEVNPETAPLIESLMAGTDTAANEG